MNRQSQIQLTPEEQRAYLVEATTMTLCTIDKNGYPHAVAMSYMVKDGCIYMTSFKKAQKVVNARRNPKVTVMIESGDAYDQLRGLMIRGDCEVIDDPQEVWNVMREVRQFRGGEAPAPPEDAVLKERAKKRAILKITPVKTSSWDHTKLPTGTY
ncbi:MAG: pyridoxamine 5'-phosphate oxidase family protein [Desulfurellaceae bacterium]|nr:pyridoxamine 5'-phosphate oxidase family protein [Desulfurellaceae bacterium]